MKTTFFAIKADYFADDKIIVYPIGLYPIATPISRLSLRGL